MSDSARSALQRAQMLVTAKRPSEALAQLGAALGDPVTAYDAFVVRASALADLGDTEAAIKAARRAQALDPLNEHAFSVEGLIRVNHLKGAGAEPVLREAVRLRANLFNRYLLVHALRGRRQRPEARAIAEQLVADFPHSAQAIDALGVVELREGRWSEAEGLYRRAVELEPHESLYTSRLGIALQGQGRTESAAEAYLAAARSDPTDVEHRHRLGRVGLSVGAAGMLAAGKLGLLTIVPKLILAIGASDLLNGGGGFKDNVEMLVLWVILLVVMLARVGYTAVRMRRGIAPLAEPLRSGLQRDNRAALGRELLGIGAFLGALAIAIFFFVASAGIVFTAISLAVGVIGWRWGGGQAVLQWVSSMWPPRLWKVSVGLAIGTLVVLDAGIIYLIYGLVLPAIGPPSPLDVALFPQFAWSVLLAVEVSLVASLRGRIRESASARHFLPTCTVAGLAIVALSEMLAAWVCFVAQPGTRSAPFGWFWILAAITTAAAIPWALRWSRSLRG